MLNRTTDQHSTPTILVYIGGVGTEIGLNFYRQMRTLADDARQRAEVIIIDSDKPGGYQELYSRLHHYFYKSLTEVRTAAFHQFGQERFPRNLGRVPVSDTSQGCGITRAFGMGSIVRNRRDFERALAGSYSRLMEAQTAASANMTRVFITASTCGGTGAGMLIDVAAMARHWFLAKGEHDPVISFFLVAPDVLTSDPSIELDEQRRRRMNASSYALMKELAAFAEGRPFETHYHSTDARVGLDTSQRREWLFDWVYLFNRQSLDGNASYTCERLGWQIAEIQNHLVFGGIGRRLNAITPNIREQREQRFPVEYQAELHTTRSDEEIRSMERNSRSAFCASWATASVRFPADEIREVLRKHWSTVVLRVLRDGAGAVFGDGETRAEGKASLLMRGRFSEEGADQRRTSIEEYVAEFGAIFGKLIDHQTLMDKSVAGHHNIEDKLEDEDEETDARLAAIAGVIQKVEALVRDCEVVEEADRPVFFQGYIDSLRRKIDRMFAPDGGLSGELLEAVANPMTAVGIQLLHGAINRLIEVKQRAAMNHRPETSLDEVRTKLKRLRSTLGGMEVELEEDQRSFFGRALRWVATQIGSRDGNEADLRSDIKDLEGRTERVRVQAKALIKAYVADHCQSQTLAVEVEGLTRFLDRLGIMAGRLSSGIDTRQAEITDALRRLSAMTGHDRFGLWASATVKNVGGSILEIRKLQEQRFVSEQQIVEGVLSILHREGLETSAGRLTIGHLHSFPSARLLQGIDAAIEQNGMLNDQLTSLDQGWILPEMREALLSDIPALLDDGAIPPIRVSAAALQPKTDCWMIAPEALTLPKPFLKRSGTPCVFPSRSKDMITVVRATFGIPPSVLYDIADWFNDYLLCIGDLADENEDMGEARFPLHVFRNAATTFSEIYQPIALIGVTAEFDVALIDLAQRLGLVEKQNAFFKSREFPFTLSIPLYEKLRNEQEVIRDEEWVDIARFRLAVSERLRRRYLMYAEFRERMRAQLQEIGKEKMEPLFDLIESIKVDREEEGFKTSTA